MSISLSLYIYIYIYICIYKPCGGRTRPAGVSPKARRKASAKDRSLAGTKNSVPIIIIIIIITIVIVFLSLSLLSLSLLRIPRASQLFVWRELRVSQGI